MADKGAGWAKAGVLLISATRLMCGARSGNGGSSSPTDGDIEAYRAVRVHEVMLNQAASAFEHAVILRLVALNGAAATAFLTLIGALSKTSGSSPPPGFRQEPAAYAVSAWVFGLLAASFASYAGLARQQRLNASYRLMRSRVESAISPTLAEIIRPPDVPVPNDVMNVQGMREKLISAAKWRYRWYLFGLWASALLFALGAWFALAATIGTPFPGFRSSSRTKGHGIAG